MLLCCCYCFDFCQADPASSKRKWVQSSTFSSSSALLCSWVQRGWAFSDIQTYKFSFSFSFAFISALLDSSWNQNQKCWATTRKAAFLGVSRSLEVGSISHSQAPYPQIFQSKSYKAQRHMYVSPSGLQCTFQSGPQPSGPQGPPSQLVWGLSWKQNFILVQRCGMHEKHEEVFQISTSY